MRSLGQFGKPGFPGDLQDDINNVISLDQHDGRGHVCERAVWMLPEALNLPGLSPGGLFAVP
jgi:hypothetical protein